MLNFLRIMKWLSWIMRMIGRFLVHIILMCSFLIIISEYIAMKSSHLSYSVGVMENICGILEDMDKVPGNIVPFRWLR